MSSILIAYGLVVAASGVLLRKMAPETPNSVLPIGITIGALCLAWGIRGFFGSKRRVEAIMTVVATTAAMLILVVPFWLAALAEQSALSAAALLTVLFLITIGMMLYLVHGERPPEFYNQTRSERQP